MVQVKIRKYEPVKDVGAVYAIENAVFGSPSSASTVPLYTIEDLLDSTGFVATLENEENIIGHIIYSINRHSLTLEIQSLAVLEKARGMGVAKELLNSVIETFSYYTIELKVENIDGHDRLVKYYNKFGFNVTGVSKFGSTIMKKNTATTKK